MQFVSPFMSHSKRRHWILATYETWLFVGGWYNQQTAMLGPFWSTRTCSTVSGHAFNWWWLVHHLFCVPWSRQFIFFLSKNCDWSNTWSVWSRKNHEKWHHGFNWLVLICSQDGQFETKNQMTFLDRRRQKQFTRAEISQLSFLFFESHCGSRLHDFITVIGSILKLHYLWNFFTSLVIYGLFFTRPHASWLASESHVTLPLHPSNLTKAVVFFKLTARPLCCSVRAPTFRSSTCCIDTSICQISLSDFVVSYLGQRQGSCRWRYPKLSWNGKLATTIWPIGRWHVLAKQMCQPIQVALVKLSMIHAELLYRLQISLKQFVAALSSSRPNN